MIVDGVELAEEIYRDLERRVALMEKKPQLRVISIAPDFATERFLKIKKKKAGEIGIELSVLELKNDARTEDVLELMRAPSDGIVCQLPYPAHINIARVLDALPLLHDVDAMGTEATKALKQSHQQVLPPVVGAIAHIAKAHNVLWKDKKVLVVGDGRLVGKPSALWAKQQGAEVVTVTREDGNLLNETKNADIIILGAGAPGILTKDMVKHGVVIFDAGTSEEGGKLVGDAAAECAEVASLFTPVPGGIGPLTIAKLFENLVRIHSKT